MRLVHGEEVYGSVLDDQTRCVHYNSELDIVAIRFRCCGKWFPCRQCHDESEAHAVQTWPVEEFSTPAVFCGVCGKQISIEDYFTCENRCPACGNKFNPGCANHYDLYFDMEF